MQRQRLVWGTGPIPCDTVIIGEAPGENEAAQGEPFVGVSGKRLNAALEAAGLDREQIYITNTYKIRPPNNRKPTEDELASHFPLLKEELWTVRPHYILLLGNTALEVVTGTTGIGSVRGVNLFPGGPAEHDLKLYATYHPSATFRSTQYREAFFQDIADFAQLIERAYTAS